MRTIFQVKQDICEVGRRMYLNGYVASNDGNISEKIDDKRVVITPTGVSKGFMSPEDIIVIDMDGNVLSGTKKPSSESGIHLTVYKSRADIKAVCHAHPPTATGFACADIPLSECLLPEVIVALGSIPIAQYGTPSTAEISDSLKPFINDYNAYLLQNHGAMTIGTDLFKAYHYMETMEHFAKIALVTRQLGHTHHLSEEDVSKLLDLRKKFGITTPSLGVTCQAPVPPGKPEEKKSAGSKEEQLVEVIVDKVFKRLQEIKNK